VVLRIGINGLGRIGRGLLRQLWTDGRFRVVALNDVADGPALAHLLNHDTYYGNWIYGCRAIPEGLQIGDRTVSLFHHSRPEQIPWEEWGVDWVVEATGRFKDRAALESHRCPVVLTASSPESDRQVVFGVNHEEVTPQDRILSATSCTTHCVVPPLYALSRRWRAKNVFFNTVHCYNVSQTLVDAPQKDLRRARSAALNLIPTTTSASLSVEAVLPEFKGKVRGMAVRVPAPAVSLTEITLEMESPVPGEEVKAALEEASKGELAGILAVTREELVSQDFLGHPASSVVDLPLVQVQGGLVRIICWYDNESGYVHRLVDLLAHLARMRE
jgi:glyceraldehyde 3-phosphate dehydrogenase